MMCLNASLAGGMAPDRIVAWRTAGLFCSCEFDLINNALYVQKGSNAVLHLNHAL